MWGVNRTPVCFGGPVAGLLLVLETYGDVNPLAKILLPALRYAYFPGSPQKQNRGGGKSFVADWSVSGRGCCGVGCTGTCTGVRWPEPP